MKRTSGPDDCPIDEKEICAKHPLPHAQFDEVRGRSNGLQALRCAHAADVSLLTSLRDIPWLPAFVFSMFLRRLNPECATDRDIASGLFLSNPDYELKNFGRLPSTDTTAPLWSRFPENTAPQHRLTFAAFVREQPVGLAQIALHAPTSDCAALLLLLVPNALQHQHVGCEIVERLSKQARRWPGIANWYISVAESNTAALGFWRHCSFRTKTQGLVCEGFVDRLTLMTRAIKARPACLHHRATENDQLVATRHLFARLP